MSVGSGSQFFVRAVDSGSGSAIPHIVPEDTGRFSVNVGDSSFACSGYGGWGGYGNYGGGWTGYGAGKGF